MYSGRDIIAKNSRMDCADDRGYVSCFFFPLVSSLSIFFFFFNHFLIIL
jgi:hypothetical protein